MRNSLRMTIKEEDVEEVDVSEKVFALQLKGILESASNMYKFQRVGKKRRTYKNLDCSKINSSASGKDEGPIVLPLALCKQATGSHSKIKLFITKSHFNSQMTCI